MTPTQNKTWQERFDEEFEDLLNFVAREYPKRNRDRHLKQFIQEELEAMAKEVRERRENEIIILADKCEKKGWSLDKFIKGLLILKERN